MELNKPFFIHLQCELEIFSQNVSEKYLLIEYRKNSKNRKIFIAVFNFGFGLILLQGIEPMILL